MAVLHAPILSHVFHWPFVKNSYLFVDFFFVLSGFVIHPACASRNVSTRADAGAFMRRIGRLWRLARVEKRFGMSKAQRMQSAGERSAAF